MVSNSIINRLIDDYLKINTQVNRPQDVIKFFNNNSNFRNYVKSMYSGLSRSIITDPVDYPKKKNHVNFIKLFTAGKVETLLNEIIGIKDEDIPTLRKRLRDKTIVYSQTYQNIEADALKGQHRKVKEFTQYLNDNTITNLIFTTQRDGKVREEHFELDGLTAEKTSEIWQTYAPPLNYNCRCYLRETTEPSNINTKDIPSIDEAKKGRPPKKTDWYNKIDDDNPLAFNPMDRDYLLPMNHTYIENASKDFFDNIKNIIGEDGN